MQAAKNSNSRMNRSFIRVALSLLGITGLAVLGLSQPTMAQTPSASSLSGTGAIDRGPGSMSADEDQGLNQMFDMFHRMQQGSIRSISEFNQDQQNSIGEAANTFRQRRIEALQQSGQWNSAPYTPSTNSSTNQPVQSHSN